MKTACGVIAYNRPRYLERSLSQLCQQVSVEAVFVDGPRDPGDVWKCEGSAKIARRADPFAQVYLNSTNLDVSIQWHACLNYLFGSLAADVAFVFEDDLVPGPRYVETLRKALSAAPMAGMVTAFMDRPEVTPYLQSGGFTFPGHLWGVAIRRWAWEECRDDLNRLVSLTYDKSPLVRVDNVRTIYEALRINPNTSCLYDGMLSAIMMQQQIPFLAVACNHGSYIGEQGCQSGPADYAKTGYGEWPVDRPPEVLSRPSDNFLAALKETVERKYGITE